MTFWARWSGGHQGCRPGNLHVMSEWRDKPWYPGRPTAIVLSETPAGWRFALTTDRQGSVDGRLGQPELTADAAQGEMLQRLRANDEVELDGEWRTDKPGWWSADLRPIE